MSDKISFYRETGREGIFIIVMTAVFVGCLSGLSDEKKLCYRSVFTFQKERNFDNYGRKIDFCLPSVRNIKE